MEILLAVITMLLTIAGVTFCISLIKIRKELDSRPRHSAIYREISILTKQIYFLESRIQIAEKRSESLEKLLAVLINPRDEIDGTFH